MNFCRLCLNTVSNVDLKEIGKYEINILGSLLIDMNLNTTKKYIICEQCLTKLDVLHKFKTMCLSTEKHVPPLIDSETSIDQADQTDLAAGSKKEKDHEDDGVQTINNGKICKLCLKVSGELGFILSESDSADDTVLYMINRCIPEVDLGVTEKQKVCKSCYDYLKDYISFMNKCLQTENRIDYFCHINGIDKTEMDLSDVIKFNSKDDILLGKGNSTLDSTVTENIGNELNQMLNETCVKAEQLEVKLEPRSDEETSIDLPNIDMQSGLYHTIFFPDPSTPSYNNFTDTTGSDQPTYQLGGRFTCPTCQLTLKSEKLLLKHVLIHGRYFECYTCGFQSRRKASLVKHFWRPEDPSDDIIHKCNICFFMSKYKHCLPHHRKTHDSEDKRYKCDMCNLQTPNRRYLNRHLLSHKDFSETTIYKCHLCPYITRQKFFLRSHVNKHSAPKFQCEFCPYKAKYSSCFRRHMNRWHKSNDEKQQYICYICAYETYDREAIVRHLQTHRNSTYTYKCDFCDFQTGLKDVFRRHVDSHINPDRKPEDLERPFQCDMCEYKTKYESKLMGHKLVHKPEPSVYRCDMCSYTSEKKTSLRRHKAIHRDRLKLECHTCQYQTLNKNSLIGHIQRHRPVVTLETFKCAECDYETKNKDNLRAHIKRHIDRSAKKVYSCDSCDYETYLQSYFRRHLWTQHKRRYDPDNMIDMDVTQMAVTVYGDADS